MRLALIFVFLLGCRDNPPVTYPTVAPFDQDRMTLGPGDKVDLEVFYGARSTKATCTLDPSGQIEVQYIGPVSASDKTIQQVKDDIQKRLADGYLQDPIVSLTVVEVNSRRLSVMGQVFKSGWIKFTPGMTVTAAIAESGGFGPMARKNLVQVTRTVHGKKEIYQVPVEMIAEGSRPNFPVMPGDEIFVPERTW